MKISDAKSLSSVLALLLPRLLLMINDVSNTVVVRNKIIEILSHLSKRIRSEEFVVIIPIISILELLVDLF